MLSVMPNHVEAEDLALNVEKKQGGKCYLKTEHVCIVVRSFCPQEVGL